jgi:hypothetical protein
MAWSLIMPRVVRAESPSEMLQAGIYQEETAGNLDEALKIYRKIVEDAAQVQKVAAQAQFRVGQCLLKQGNKTEATRAFETLIKQFPDERELVAKSRSYLPAPVTLLPAPWQSGERLTLALRLPNGQAIGLIGLGIDADRVGDKDVWRMSIRRFVMGGQSQGTSIITVDRQQNKPLRTEWDHTILGATTAEFDEGKVRLTIKSKPGEPTSKTVDLAGVRYSNDQGFYVFRQLPLEVGFKSTLPVIVEFASGNQLDIGVEVPAKDKIETPVGTFDCFRLELNIGQTFWISDTPERYVVKFEAEGMSGVLSSIHKNEPRKVSTSAGEFSVEVPGSWHAVELAADGDVGRGIFMVPPQMAAVRVQIRERSLLSATERVSNQAWTDGRMKDRQRLIKEFAIRDNGTMPSKIAGHDAVSVIYAGTLFGRSVVGYDTMCLTEDSALLFAATTAADAFDSVRPELEKIRDSVTLKK